MSENELFKVSLNKSMAQCSQKELCTEDIRKKLSLWGVEHDDIEKIIVILLKEKFIDEQVCESKPVILGEDIWLGTKAIVLPGVTIGRGAVIGAGAVVTGSK